MPWVGVDEGNLLVVGGIERYIFTRKKEEEKTETMCMPPPRTPRTMVQVEAAGQTYKQVQSFTYLRGAVTEIPDMSVR